MTQTVVAVGSASRLHTVVGAQYSKLSSIPALWGVQLRLGAPQRGNEIPKRKLAVEVQAFLVPPVLLQAAQKVVIRAAPGRLALGALATARRAGGWRVAAVLVLYSLVATLIAAKQTKKVRALSSVSHQSLQSTDFAENLPMVSGDIGDGDAMAAAFDAASSEPCPLCDGRGSINWEGLKVHEDHPCPKCLGTGQAKTDNPLSSFWKVGREN